MERTHGVLISCLQTDGYGLQDILVYCLDLAYNHLALLNAHPVPGHVFLSDLEPRMRCTRCGKRGADIRGRQAA